MASARSVTRKFRDDNQQFPIHWEGNDLRVFTNPCGELFVEDVRSGVTMRINSFHPGNGIEFTTSGRVEPVRVSNMIGWSIRPR